MDTSLSSSEKGRLMSPDALRGFDMLFLTAIGGILIATGKSCYSVFFDTPANQCHHTEWIGLHT
jgi:hypothetical protein